MDGEARRWLPERVVVIAALAFGVTAGTYGIANAATGSSSGSNDSSALSARHGGQPWGRQRAADR